MNVESLFFKEPIEPLTPSRRKAIIVCRFLVPLFFALLLPSFIQTIMAIRRGVSDEYPYQHLNGILLPITMIFQGSFVWFMTAARLHPAKARRNLVISSIFLVISFVLGSISFWLALHID